MSPTHNAQREVEDMIERGVPFEHVESYIEARSDLSEDQRSALWLLAWCETSNDRRRSVVALILAELDPPQPPRRRRLRRAPAPA